ncbi:unnamed protein product, partial [marine sediment metagenome]
IGNCTKRGFHYGTTTDYGSDVYEEGSFGEGAYNLQITDLTPEETYHYQAFILDANGDEQVGEDKTLTTTTAPSRYYALIIASPNEVKVFDMEGNVLYLLTTGAWSYAAC